MKVIDRTPLMRRYGGKWVAFKKNRKTVLASGMTAVSVLAEARKQGYMEPIITRIPKHAIPFVGGYRITA